MSIAENIKKYRKAKGYTQNDLAELLNVKPTTISAWEVGRNKPLMDKIEMLSNILGVKKSDLIGEEKINNDITLIYSQLETPRQNKVYDYAKQQLNEQNDVNNSITGYIRSIDEQEEKSDEKHVDLTDDDAIFTYEGRKIPKEDLEMIKRFMRGKE